MRRRSFLNHESTASIITGTGVVGLARFMNSRVMKQINPIKTSQKIALFAAALCFLAAAARAQTTYTWTNLISGNASGSWAAATNWQGGVVAGGANNTADFSTLDLAADSTVTLDGNQTIGNLIFGDAAPGNNWNLAAGSGGALTLAVSSGQPTISTPTGSNNIAAVLVNTALPSGITKTGNGLLQLGAANLTTNVINNINGGVLQVANNNALGYTTTGTVGTNNVASGATLNVPYSYQLAGQRAFISGAGLGGTNGAFRADAGTGYNQQNTRFSYALNSVANPAFVLTTDATIRVDGAGWPQQAGVLVGAITNNAAGLNYTLTVAGTGELRIDPPAEIAVATINVAGGVLGLNGNGPNNITRTQVVNVASGAALGSRRNHAYNASGSFLTLNGIWDLNYNPGATANTSGNTWYQLVGSLQGSGVITNSSLAPQTLYVVSGTSNSIFNGTINPGTNGAITFRKEGQNTTMWLGGSCAFNGLNQVIGGIEYINGSWNPSSGFSVANGSGATSATLAGKGSTTSPITLGSATSYVSAGDPTQGGGTLTVGNITGSGNVVVSNANLALNGMIGSLTGFINNLYATNGTISFALNNSDASIYASSVNIDGAVTLSFTTANPTVGQFPVIVCGSLGGLAGFNGLTLSSPPGLTAVLSNNTYNGSVDIVIMAVPALKWTGAVNGNWDIATTANWFNGSIATNYTESDGAGPRVIFDDTATGSTAVNVTATVSPQGITVNNTNKTYTYSGSGTIAGTNGLTKLGSGTLIVANSNSFSGNISVSAGTMQIGNGGTAGTLGSGPVDNESQLVFNRSDNYTVANTISGLGSLTKQGAGMLTMTGNNTLSGGVDIAAGTLNFAPSTTATIASAITDAGGVIVSGSGTVVFSDNGGNSYSGSTVISNATLQLGDSVNVGSLPSASVLNNGALVFGNSSTVSGNISGTGGISVIGTGGAAFTAYLGGNNSYTGPTVVRGGNTLTLLTATALPSATLLTLGSTAGGADAGTLALNGGNVVVGGLNAGGDGNLNNINFNGSGQKLTIAGNVNIGQVISHSSISLQVSGADSTLSVVTNGGIIQLGLTPATAFFPDGVVVNLSALGTFTADLGPGGALQMGSIADAASTYHLVNNQMILANLTNSISAGTLRIGAGGRENVPQLALGAGTNIINCDVISLGVGSTSNRDSGTFNFNSGTGSVTIRAYNGASPATLNIGTGSQTTGAIATNTFDVSGHYADILLGSLNIGDQAARAGSWQQTFSFDQGLIVVTNVSLSAHCLASTSGSSTMNIGGGTATLGAVSLTASTADGTLNISNATVTVNGIAATGAGNSTLALNNSTLNIALASRGNPATAPVVAKNFSAAGTINLGVSGTNWIVGQFPLISYTGSIGGDGYPALHLVSLPAGVIGYLSNNVTAASVDIVVTSAPVFLNPNPPMLQVSVSGGALNIGWPTNGGWILQSNSVGVAASNAWFNYPGDGSVNATNVSITLQPGKTNVFFRLVSPQ